MSWTSALWGIFALGVVVCVLGSVPWKAAGLCQCCCRAALGLSLSPVTCASVPAPVTPCARLLQRVLGFRHHKSPPPGAETPSQRTSVTLCHRGSFRVAISLPLLLHSSCCSAVQDGCVLEHPGPSPSLWSLYLLCRTFATWGGCQNLLTAVQSPVSSFHSSSVVSSVPFPFPAKSMCVKLWDAPPRR